ncbi:FecCD family ABC transporter permease [Stackebrandtia soli]|uniref:FecCD family ABC transporter permease n=1 Tax=Stackebrandtia soli TaxID=1892856 RepID=UPI0039EB5C82
MTLTTPRLATRAHRTTRRRRSLTVNGTLALATLALFTLTMMVGSYLISATDVLLSTFSIVENPSVDFVIHELRLPPAATALFVGAALGLSGIIFQQLLANPLASPDFVGISSGASLAAVGAIIFGNIGGLGISVAALVGALVSSGIVYLLAWRDGISGYRFILIGIGVSQFTLSIVGYVIARADLNDARAAMTWLMGSVGQAGPTQLTALMATVAIAIPVAMVLERHLRTLALGDDTARGLGARTELARFALIALALILVAVATAAAGPLAFVALLAGPIARRILGPASAGLLVASALVGALIVLAANLVSVHLLPSDLPTGIITGAVGAPYLIWLLATVNREGRGG